MPFPHETILGLGFFSALVDAFPHHSWPLATRGGEMHQLVLRKTLTLELPHVEKIHCQDVTRIGGRVDSQNIVKMT